MPSDERTQRALEALADRVTSFRTAMVAARDEMREHLASHRSVERDRTQAAMRSLGQFASGRIDTQRFGVQLGDERALAPETSTLVETCADVLDELLARGDALFVHRVPSGGLLRGSIDAALANAGRAFAAARVFQSVRRGNPPIPVHESMLREFPFALWSRTERDFAPPLVVAIDGADLRAEHLVEFLDGGMRMVLVVEGTASPAPLVRLIAPSVLVLQTSDVTALDALRRAPGPAVGALLPKGCAELLHDPRAGARLDERLTVTPPATGMKGEALGWRSARQALDEIAQLDALVEVCRAAREVAVVVRPPANLQGAADGVEVVASWLLAQAGLKGGAA